MVKKWILRILTFSLSIIFVFSAVGCSKEKSKVASSKASSKKINISEKNGLNDVSDEVTEEDMKDVTAEQIQNFCTVYKEYANELTKINNLFMTDISGNRTQCETIKSGVESLREQLLQNCPESLKDKLNSYFNIYDDYYSFVISKDKYDREAISKYSEPDKERYVIENKVIAMGKKLGSQVSLY